MAPRPKPPVGPSENANPTTPQSGRADDLPAPFADVYGRRDVLKASAGFAFFCPVISNPSGMAPSRAPRSLGSDQPMRSAPARNAKARRAFAPYKRDLPIPKVLKPVSTEGGRDRYELEMKPGSAEILPGMSTPIIGYGGTFPGPTIHAQRGRPVEITHRNRLGNGEDTVVHLHGGVTEAASDGHPMDLVPDGGERVYNYANEQPGAMLWYHDHAHGMTARTVYQGLAGMYLLREPLERKLDLPRGDFDVPLMIADRAFNGDGSLRYPSTIPLGQGFFGDTVLVNGAVVPRMAVKRRIYRFRILNASNARIFKLALGNRVKMTQIGGDGGFLPKPVKRTEIAIGPAERVDVLIDFRQFRPGSKVRLRNLAADVGSVAQVMRFDVGRGGGSEQARIPKKLRRIEPLGDPVTERLLRLSLREAPSMEWQINGRGYADERIDFQPRLGSTELWSFVNDSDFYHPMHTHLAHFRIIDIDGKRPHPGDRGWKDTVMVGARQTARVLVHFGGTFTGRYVFHCHALEHGDINMMGQMEVTL